MNYQATEKYEGILNTYYLVKKNPTTWYSGKGNITETLRSVVAGRLGR
jgi:hypothetical protein